MKCREERDFLDGIGGMLRGGDSPAVASMRVELRERVLDRCAAELARRPAQPPTRRARASSLLLAAGVAAAVALLALSPSGTRLRALDDAASPPATIVDATGEQGARWTRTTDERVETIDLRDGALHLRVARSPGGKRVLVRVPDGEIEDLGTVFSVVVRDGATQRVDVQEGEVSVRLRGLAPIAVSHGHTWERVAPPPPPATTAESTAPPPATPARAVASHPATAQAARPAPPGDPTGDEDRAYLAIVDLARAGRRAEARAAAADYLRRFPDGFRREEVGAIAK